MHPYGPYTDTRTNQQVYALQMTPKPPASSPPDWLSAAYLAGLIKAGPVGLEVLLPTGWQTVGLYDWVVYSPANLGLQVCSLQDFYSYYSVES